jgi:SAM-dependent methyltransferase
VLPGYDELIAEAMTVPFRSWDFGVFRGRFTEHHGELPWSYRELVAQRLPHVASPLDLGTGGGELLASLAPLPARTAATEGYPPNVPVARERLTPLGIEVADVTDGPPLPFPDGSFELVTSRHEAYDPAELRRVLAPGGTFVTQQVGGRDLAEVNEALGAPRHQYHDWQLAAAVEQLEAAGFEVTWQREAGLPGAFHDIGALVLFLRITPWQVPGFTVERYAERLRALDADLRAGRPLRVTSDRFVLVGRPR